MSLAPERTALDVAAAIDETRQWTLLQDLARIGGLDNGGVNRQALSATDTEAKNFLAGWAARHGLEAMQDEAANLYVRCEGARPDAAPLLIGSHIDTQPTGGKYDGAYGVVAGLELLAALRVLALRPGRAIEVVAWTNEEGSRFLPGATGSSVFAGTRDLAKLVDATTSDGARVGDELRRSIAGTQARSRPANAIRPHAYLEAHIEQGPILEREGLPIGIVTGIQGVRRLAIEIEGRSAHAGTTPHSMRQDALLAATRLVQAAQPLVAADERLRLTFGRIECWPNVPNTVPSRVRLTIDLRHPEQLEIDAVTQRLERLAADAAPCAGRVEVLSSVAPVAFDPSVMALLTAAADRVGARHRALLSGAGHDAMHLARICPAGMVFVPCKDGVSHHESESAEPGDLAAGTRVLAYAAWRLANG